MTTGNQIIVNQFHRISVSKGGNVIKGVISADYSFSRKINNLYTLGKSTAIATYGDMPEITVSYTGHATYMGSFSVAEANEFTTIDINGANGSVSVDLALLTSYNYNFQTDGPFTITKTFTGYSKPSGGGGGTTPTFEKLNTLKRADYGGSLPPGIQGNYLQSVSAEISINRQNIGQFATRKPYASIVSYPIIQSITYEVLASSMDSITVSDIYNACQNPGSAKYQAGISACGVSHGITKAYVTNIQYSGGEASQGSKPQTINITYTSYEDISGLEPIIYFP